MGCLGYKLARVYKEHWHQKRTRNRDTVPVRSETQEQDKQTKRKRKQRESRGSKENQEEAKRCCQRSRQIHSASEQSVQKLHQLSEMAILLSLTLANGHWGVRYKVHSRDIKDTPTLLIIDELLRLQSLHFTDIQRVEVRTSPIVANGSCSCSQGSHTGRSLVKFSTKKASHLLYSVHTAEQLL